MTPDLITSLGLASPELIVAIGAMVLLMIGVYSGERAGTTVTGLAVATLIGACGWMLIMGRQGDAFGDAFVDYFLTIKEAEIARAGASAKPGEDPAAVSDWEHREYFDLE